jgi:hypothetical protein
VCQPSFLDFTYTLTVKSLNMKAQSHASVLDGCLTRNFAIRNFVRGYLLDSIVLESLIYKL